MTTSSHSIRRLSPADQPFLWEMLYQSLYLPEGSPPFPRDIVNRPEVAKYVREWGRAGDMGLVAVETGGQPIGAAWLRLLTGVEKGYGYVDEETPELGMAVLAGHRGRGVGSELLGRLLETAAGVYRSVSLSVSADNPAVRLYERAGFELVRTCGDALTMVKRLHAHSRMSPRLTPTVLRFDSLPSTNTEAARQAALGAPEGLCVVAREQTAGRGRRERIWVSPKDAGLYLSVVLRPTFETRRWPLITLAAALAVRDALREACALEADIKWPNDLLAGGRKLCGILAETAEGVRGRAVVLGIGVNLRRGSFPEELSDTATSIEEQAGHAPDAESILAALTRALAARYETLHAAGGAEEILRDWQRHSTYAHNRRVRVALAAETFEGTTRGLDPDGALRVETDEGEIKTVRAGDVTALRQMLSDSCL